METLFEFNYNDKKYVSLLDNDQIVFGCIENGVFSKELTDFESRLIKSIYNYLVGDKEYLIRLTSFEYNNNNVKPYYNEKNRLYYFECNDIETLKTLNYLFNNQNTYVNHKKGSKNNNDKFNIFFKWENKILAVIVASSIMMSTLPSLPKNEILFDIDYRIDSLYKDFEPKEVDDEEIYRVLNTLANNPNLTDEEKQFISGCYNELKENKAYIDFEKLNRNFEELRINYNPNTSEYNGYQSQIMGLYNCIGKKRNQIDLYADTYGETPCDDFSTCNKGVLNHELNHAYTSYFPLMTIPGELGDIASRIYVICGLNMDQLPEMTNELFTREYQDDYSSEGSSRGYPWVMPPMYALAEIIDEDVLRTYKFNSDNYYITKYLTELGVPKKDVYDLLKSLDLVYAFEENYAAPDSSMRDYLNKRLNYKNIKRIIDECYECKYNRKADEDLNMILCFYGSDYVKEDYNERVRELLNVEEITAIVPRGYVSSNYIAKHPYFVVYTNQDFNEYIEITDDIRYLNNSLSNTM